MRALIKVTMFCLICGADSAAEAQWIDGYGYSNKNPISAVITKAKWPDFNSRLVFEAGLKEKGHDEKKFANLTLEELENYYFEAELDEAKFPSSKAGFATQFVPTSERILMPTIIQHMTSEPDELTELTASFEEFLTRYEESTKESGFENDLAGSISCLAAAAFMVIDGKEVEDGGAYRLMQAIRLKFNTPEVKRVSAIEKQKFQEFMATMTCFLMLSDLIPTEDPTEESEIFRETARDVLVNYLGIDPTKVTMTGEGLVSRTPIS